MELLQGIESPGMRSEPTRELTVVGREILKSSDARSKTNNNTGAKKKKKKRKPDIIAPSPSSTTSTTSTTTNSPSASPNPIDKRWFSVYDVFRCKQLHVELSALTANSHRCYTRSKSKNKNAATAAATTTTTSNASKRRTFPQERQLVKLPGNHHEDGEEEKKSFRFSEEEQEDDRHQQQQKDRKKAEMWRRMEMVRRLQSGDIEEQTSAAADIRAACRRDGDARTTLALMGAIPPLVAMLDSLNTAAAAAGLAALLNLSVRNDQNKAAIVAAGAIPKILRLAKSHPGSHIQMQLLESSVAALLSLSALDANKLAIAASPGAGASLVATVLDSSSTDQARRDAMAALYNLSLCPTNAPVLCAAAAVPAVLSAAYEPELCSRAVATAANLVSTSPGRRAMARVESSCLVFTDILNWGRCGYCPSVASPYRGGVGGTVTRGLIERAVYVVMVLAQCSQSQRRAMCRAGCSSMLLELVLIGSPAVQDRASRTLQCLAAADDDNSSSTNSYCCLLLQEGEGDDEQHQQHEHQQRRQLLERELYSEERRAVNRLVERSLKINMQRITERACIPLAAGAASDVTTAATGTTATSSSSSSSTSSTRLLVSS
ncbi:hypothetical protein SELMODRAFT_402458 [Selaginella moellendorffii]|uniref:Armadillo repeat-containing domain-containing protein n=2 Tax=Selaginella moellendorffii TaxID=88036 RepID=D8QQQ0_SELML|nr:hypothetical protein SELMODRAFT_402458 [Selaginella moellendorffii]